MFSNLTERLSRTVKSLSGRGRITEDNIRDTVRQIRMALLEADVAVSVAKAFVERVRERALGEEVAGSLNPGQVFVKIINDELVAVLGGQESAIARSGRPTVIMLAGLQGAGKTTTAGKLAVMLGKTPPADVMLASTDVHRPAAREQLEQLAKQVGARFFVSESSDPVEIAGEATRLAAGSGVRWLIVDTAGRMHVDEAMMDEARAVHAAIAPQETLFVLDSMAGQDAVNSAAAFHDALSLTGVILTKADGDARGGAALSVKEVTGLPIKLVGTGEKLDALEVFVPSRFASRILGMGDVVGLVEQVESSVDRAAAERVATKVKRGRDLDLEDFKQQLEQVAGMGGLAGLMDKLPGVPAGAMPPGFDDAIIKRQIAIINSMTPKERRQPGLINGSRKRRIAAGAGQPIQDVNRLLKQHKQIAKTMKRVAKGGMAGMQNLLGTRMPGGARGQMGRRGR